MARNQYNNRKPRAAAKPPRKKGSKKMSTGVAVVILLEVVVFLFCIYGFLHEDKFIAFEGRIIKRIKERGCRK